MKSLRAPQFFLFFTKFSNKLALSLFSVLSESIEIGTVTYLLISLSPKTKILFVLEELENWHPMCFLVVPVKSTGCQSCQKISKP